MNVRVYARKHPDIVAVQLVVKSESEWSESTSNKQIVRVRALVISDIVHSCFSQCEGMKSELIPRRSFKQGKRRTPELRWLLCSPRHFRLRRHTHLVFWSA